MTTRPEPGTFEGFLDWLDAVDDAGQLFRVELPAMATMAAREAWQAVRTAEDARRSSITERIAADSYREDIELLAAADFDRTRWVPRLRTPNGFYISALYAGDKLPGAGPVGLLVECPAGLIDVCRGRLVHISIGGRWFPIGEIDQDGKVAGDLPIGLEFQPPFAFRVGSLAEEELPKLDEPP